MGVAIYIAFHFCCHNLTDGLARDELTKLTVIPESLNKPP